jgi:hybrid polyketide synthase/nonribosomal peptide synthetase ACE1
LSESFFGYGNDNADDVLYVGSVKTIIGHTEGTAGISGVLKASMALKNAVIPPNLLLNRLNPNVAPFYTNMRILKEAQPWPEIPDNTPRRASVNSFGIGPMPSHPIVYIRLMIWQDLVGQTPTQFLRVTNLR